MKIVRVVYSEITQNEIETEKLLLSLENYDIESFIIKQSNDIINKSSYSNLTSLAIASLLVEAAIIPYTIRKIREAKNKTYRVDVKEVIKHSVSALLQDIRTRLSENTEVISLESAKQKYPRTQNLSIGTYSLHPYDTGRLTRLEHYHKNLALEKDNELIVLLGKMGAKTVRIVETDSQQKSGSISAGARTIPVEAKGDLSLAQRIERGKELLVAFEGNVIEIDPNLLRTSLWFSNDGQLNAIFESRRFTPNKIQDYTLRNTYTETFDFNFDLAVRYLAVKADLKAEYDFISKTERFFHVEFGR